MLTYTSSVLALLAGLLLVGCVTPGPNSDYFALDPDVAEASRRNTHRVEQEGRDMDHLERMRRAEAYEVATRHAPTHVSTTTVYAPVIW